MSENHLNLITGLLNAVVVTPNGIVEVMITIPVRLQ